MAFPADNPLLDVNNRAAVNGYIAGNGGEVPDAPVFAGVNPGDEPSSAAVWAAASSSFDERVIGLIYAENRFVAMTSRGTLYGSTDGSTWSIQAATFTGSSGFVPTASSGLSQSVTWNAASAAELTYGGGKFIAVILAGGRQGSQFPASRLVWASDDGVTWSVSTPFPEDETSFSNDLKYLNGNFVLAQQDGGIWTSTNGSTWTKSATLAEPIGSITYGNGLYVAGGDGASDAIYTSTNLTVWTRRQTGLINSGISALAFGGGVFVAGGARDIWTSTNGTSWTKRSPNFVETSNTISDIGYTNGKFYTGYTGRIYSSSDGITWSLELQTSNAFGVVYAATSTSTNIYVASGTAVWRFGTSAEYQAWVTAHTAYNNEVDEFNRDRLRYQAFIAPTNLNPAQPSGLTITNPGQTTARLTLVKGQYADMTEVDVSTTSPTASTQALATIDGEVYDITGLESGGSHRVRARSVRSLDTDPVPPAETPLP